VNGTVSERGRVVRWPAILLLAAAIALMAIVERDATPAQVDPSSALERPLVPTAGRSESLSSTWYCAAGTIVEDGLADHTLVIANPSGRTARVELTSYPVLAPEVITVDLEADELDTDIGLVPPEAIDLGAVSSSLSVAARTVERVRIADLGVGGEHAAVLVESNVGDMVVEHIVAGADGAGIAPCASASAQEWHFAAGTTRDGARELIAVFNPFPDDAVVDIEFVADGTNRAPQIYTGLVVPSGTVLPIEITNVVTLFDVVSTDLRVRTGRVVADRLLVFDGSVGPAGLSVAAGSVAPSSLWVFASSAPDGGADVIVITNPSETEAEVDVEVHLDLPELNGTVEPIGLAIRPGRTEVVVLSPGAELVSASRVFDASDRVLDDTGYWVSVRSLDGTPVVADHLTLAANGVPVGASASPGQPVAATIHVMTSGDGVGEIAVVNPALDRIVRADIRIITEGQEFAVIESEVARGARLVVDLETLGIPPDALVVIETTDPVHIERRLALAGFGSVTAQAIPVAGTTSPAIVPFG
jgi:hypothetical protein